MRRLVAFGVVVAALLGSACATSTERPEGVVERWLNSLNQGSAGDPDAYASDEVSRQVVPHWETLDPGELDVIEVGRAAPIRIADLAPEVGGVFDQVPFRIVRTSGEVTRGVALVEHTSNGLRVARLEEAGAAVKVPPLPSEGGPRVETVAPFVWLAALAAAGLFILVAAGLMAIARRKPATA